MRDGYRLARQNKYEWHLLCPFGQPIAHIQKYALGIFVTPLIEGIGDRQNFRIESDNRQKAATYEQHPDMEAACRPFVEGHYKINTTRQVRLGNKLTELSGNPFWPWLFGLIATIAAIWGWID